MGKRSQRERRQKGNRYRNYYGTIYQKWDEKRQRYYWAGGRWSPAQKQWQERAKNWPPSAPLYFAYGSNLNMAQMALRAPEATPFAGLALPDWKLVFRGVADIAHSPGAEVQGGLWRITGADERALDMYEGVASGLYVKDYFDVTYTDGEGNTVTEKALVYIMANGHRLDAPSDYYLDVIREGYEDFDLDQTCLNQAVSEAPRRIWTPTYYSGQYYGGGARDDKEKAADDEQDWWPGRHWGGWD